MTAVPSRNIQRITGRLTTPFALEDGSWASLRLKKLTLGPQNVLTQAERYSKGASTNLLSFRDFHVPFLYSTNGEVIWHHDIRHALDRSHTIAAFHTPEALEEKFSRDFNGACELLLQTPNDHPRLRPYQREANAAIEKALADRKRQMLIAMATGTGKTFTMVNEVYRLMKSGVAKRILFLVDRRALAAQAILAFASFEPEPGLKFDKIYELYSQRFHRDDFDEDAKFDPKILPNSYLTNPQPGHAFVYVSTIQRMTINLLGPGAVFRTRDEEGDDDAPVLDIPINAFDLIIADECHRGYSTQEIATWRKTLDHFDAVKIGLTATPAAHSMAMFKEITYRYEYERAVREGYLVDYDHGRRQIPRSDARDLPKRRRAGRYSQPRVRRKATRSFGRRAGISQRARSRRRLPRRIRIERSWKRSRSGPSNTNRSMAGSPRR